VASCPICGSTARADHAGRAGARCEGCGALERHRALVVELASELQPRASGRCLELGPRSPRVFGEYLVNEKGWEYTAFDRWDMRSRVDPDVFASFIDYDADATDVFFAATGTYELFITQHVIEEVVDYQAALDEVARVLEPGGRALLEIPFSQRRERTVRQEPDRYDNVWSFGRDLIGHLQARFDEVTQVALREGEYRGAIFICRRLP
jgi:SAM-dependent methyltransferase